MKRAVINILLLICLLVGGFGCSTVGFKRRIREPICADYSVSDPEFNRSMSHLLNPPLIGGNNVVELLNGDQIFPSMLEAIRHAQKSITFETYIWSPGKVGRQFIEAFVERAHAGVRINVIIDALGSGKFSVADQKELTDAGVEFEIYNPPFFLKILRANHRTHRKQMVVDGRIGFTGGVCIDDKWAGNAEPGQWRDTHFRVDGPVVAQMQAVFVDNWLQTRCEVLHGEDYFPEIKPAGTMIAQDFKSGPDSGGENALLTYLLSIAAAQKSIRMEHAYFVPNDLAVKTLLEARKRGVRIQIIVPAKIDNFLVHMASRSRWAKLLDAGVEFYEYQPTLYHCKVMIVDDIWVTAGSVNFDERSFRINDEANLNVLDKTFAAEMNKTFEADKSKSRRLTAKDFRRRSWVKKFFYHSVGLLQSQL